MIVLWKKIWSKNPKVLGNNFATTKRFLITKFDGTVKLGDKEWFDKKQIGVKEPFPVTNFLLHKDKDYLALRNNVRATRIFLITKFDWTYIISTTIITITYI